MVRPLVLAGKLTLQVGSQRLRTRRWPWLARLKGNILNYARVSDAFGVEAKMMYL